MLLCSRVRSHPPGRWQMSPQSLRKMTTLAFKTTIQYHCSAWSPPSVLERYIHKKILPFLQPIISYGQHGFMPNRSCVTQLVGFTHNLGSTYDRGCDTNVVWLDFSKAFDSVNHSKLIEKLRYAGIGGSLLAWFNNYLEARLQRVVINGAYSDLLPVTSGVPQVSILWLLLFVIFINDMPSCVSPDTCIALFADDAKLYRTISSIDDQVALQNDLNALNNMSKTWDIDFNAKKCVVLQVKTCKRHHITNVVATIYFLLLVKTILVSWSPMI